MRTHTIEIEVEDPDDAKDTPWAAHLAAETAQALAGRLPVGLEVTGVRAMLYVPQDDAAPPATGVVEVADVPFDGPVQ